MSYSSFVVDRFGGLDLVNDPEEVGADRAVDLLNVDLDERGRLRSRPGTAAYVSQSNYSASTMAVLPTDNEVVVGWIGATPNVRAYDAAGVQQATTNAPALSMAVIGTPTASSVYFSDASTLYKWNGSAFSSTAGQGGQWLAASNVDNRLVVARTSTNPYRVFFSDPGDPETFGANNYVDLNPGDGEPISGLAAWRDMLFVFKRSRFYVFYGTSTDGTGNPVFNYRTVDAGVGATGQYSTGSFSVATACVSARDGVYFTADDGVYRTDGGDPVKVSRNLDPWFDGKTLPLATNLPSYSGAVPPRMSADAKRVFVNFASSKTFVYSIDTSEWTLYNLAVQCGTPYPSSATSKIEMLFGLSGKVVKHYETYTTDEGVAISSAYQSGFYDLGSPDVKTIRETVLWGSGSPTLSVFTDHGSSDSSAAAVVLGATSPVVADARQRVARRGTFFSHKLSATLPWSVNRVTHHVREKRLVGVE